MTEKRIKVYERQGIALLKDDNVVDILQSPRSPLDKILQKTKETEVPAWFLFRSPFSGFLVVVAHSELIDEIKKVIKEGSVKESKYDWRRLSKTRINP